MRAHEKGRWHPGYRTSNGHRKDSRRSPRLPYQPGWAKWQHLRTCSRIQVCSKPSRSRCVSLALALGSHDLIDFVAVLIGYVLSGEPTLLSFYERLTPWADAFMAQIAARPLAPSLDLVPISGNPRPEHGGSPAHPFSRGWACTRSLSFRLQACSTGQACGGWSSTWMEPDKRLAGEHCRKRTCCLLPIAGSRLCARQAIKAASEEKWSVPER
jgi:hypothetical protein